MKTIVFAIDEVGSFAYLETLFRKWLDEKPKNIEWFVVVDPVIENFKLYKNIQDALPLLSIESALKRSCDLLVLSITNKPTFTLKLIDKAQNTLAFSDIWSKVWNIEDYQNVDAIAVIDEEHANLTKQQGWDHDIHIVGQPAWEGIEPLPVAPVNSILYAAQPIHKHYGLSLGYDEHTLWDFLCDITRDVPGCKLTYALHPAQDTETLPDNATFSYDAQEALQTHGTIVSAFSSLLLDAWLGGRNTLSLQPGQRGQEKCFLSKKGFIPLIQDKNEFISNISDQKMQKTRSSLSFVGSVEKLKSLCEQN
jgi:hypothetical protein